MTRRITPILVILVLVLVAFAACAPAPNVFVDTASKRGTPAGFWMGLWHGCIAPITFIVSLFKDNLNIYELHNNGAWYNFGFLLGTSFCLGGSRGARWGWGQKGPKKSKEKKQATDQTAISEFLAQRRLALVGLSHDPQDFSRGLFRELRQRGYDMVPVNPAHKEIDGLPCYARVQDISPKVDGALILTPAAKTEGVVRDCLEAGVRRVWLHRAIGQGAVSQEALDLCAKEGVQVVAGECPYMFLPNAGGIHQVHGFFRRLSEGRA